MQYTQARIEEALSYRAYDKQRLAAAEARANNPKLDWSTLTEQQANDVALWRSKTEQEWAEIEELAETILPNVGDQLYYDGPLFGHFLTIVGMNHLIAIGQYAGLRVIVPLDRLDMSFDDRGKMHYFCNQRTEGIQVSNY